MTGRVSVLIEKFNFLLHKNHSLLSSKKICSNIVFCDALYSHSSSSLKVYRVKWLNDETNIVRRMQIRCNSCCCLPDHNLTPLTHHAAIFNISSQSDLIATCNDAMQCQICTRKSTKAGRRRFTCVILKTISGNWITDDGRLNHSLEKIEQARCESGFMSLSILSKSAHCLQPHVNNKSAL